MSVNIVEFLNQFFLIPFYKALALHPKARQAQRTLGQMEGLLYSSLLKIEISIVLGLLLCIYIIFCVKQGTDLAYFKHIFAAGNLNYGITEICCIFKLYHNSNFPLQKYA